MSSAKASERMALNVADALHAICSTGKGRCWFCDRRLPNAEEAVRAGWDVRRVEGERVASIILICPRCLPSKNVQVSDLTLAARV
jgi:hypothetical protein